MSVGIDIIQISRIAQALERRPALGRRLFTPAERKYCDAQRNPFQHYAARFAAKEAVAKALGHSFSWQDVEIRRAQNGKPRVLLRNLARMVAAGRKVTVSISHNGDYAVACAVLESKNE